MECYVGINVPRHWCTDLLASGSAPSRVDQVWRTVIGLAPRIMRLSTWMASSISPASAAALRARSLGPIRCLYLPMAVSAAFLLPYRSCAARPCGRARL